MLREDTLKIIQAAIVRGESVNPTRDEVRALELRARQLRAQATRDAIRNGFSWLLRNRSVDVPAGRIDTVRSH